MDRRHNAGGGGGVLCDGLASHPGGEGSRNTPSMYATWLKHRFYLTLPRLGKKPEGKALGLLLKTRISNSIIRRTYEFIAK